jgi:hypothetical protein
MPTELLQTRIFGNAIGNANSAITAKANSGFSNMVVLTNGGISATRVWEFPLALQVPDAKFKVTILGAGGQGGGCNVAGRVATGSGGGAGGLLMVWFHVLQGCYQLQYIVGVGGTTGTLTTAGQNGSNTSLWYWNGSYGSTADYIGNGGTGGGLSTNVSNISFAYPNALAISISLSFSFAGVVILKLADLLQSLDNSVFALLIDSLMCFILYIFNRNQTYKFKNY